MNESGKPHFEEQYFNKMSKFEGTSLMNENELSAIQQEIVAKQQHLKELMEQQAILETLNGKFGNIDLRLKNKYNNISNSTEMKNNASSSYNPLNVNCPPIFRQVKSKIISLIKKCLN